MRQAANHVLFTVLILLCSLMTAFAQNNPFKINDRLYLIYSEAYINKYDKSGLKLADSLYREAVAIGDKKAECIAKTIPVYYYMNQEDSLMMEKTVSELKEISEKNGYMQYYYFAEKNKINFLINHHRYYSALMITNEMRDHATRHNHEFGIFTAMRSIGDIYVIRGEYRAAEDVYKEALKYGLVHLPDQDMSAIYLSLAFCYHYMRNYEKQIEACEQGLKVSIRTSWQSVASLKLKKLQALAFLGRDEEFIKEQSLLTERDKKTGLLGFDDYAQYEMMDLMIREGNQAGYNYIEKQKKRKLRDTEKIDFIYKLQLIYYERIKDYENAYKTSLKIQALRDSLNQDVIQSDMSEVSARIDNGLLTIENQKSQLRNERLLRANARLALNNTKLSLENTSLELGRARWAEREANLRVKNSQLNLSYKQLEANQLKDSLQRQIELQSERDSKVRIARIFNVVILLTFVLLLIFVTLYLYHRKRSSEALKASYNKLNLYVEELEKARDKAEQADKMKTMFIQNMSHEIRTPLNAIVGFSQLLSSMSDTLSDEEKKDMSCRITENSDMLATIIDDILDLTTIESGKYVMVIKEENANHICQNALQTVMHRKPKNVEMIFTTDVPDDFTLKTDANRVKQVLINFLTNATKNTTEGEIRLHACIIENPKRLHMSVSDTGIGIPADKMEEIFERFKKLDNFKQGTGLGLNICQAIAARLNGSIYIDKEYRNGARFIFDIKL